MSIPRTNRSPDGTQRNPGNEDPPPIDYRPYALRYLLLWLEHDRDARAAFNRESLPSHERLRRVARAAQFYGVARNLHRPPGVDRDSHYKRLLDTISGLPRGLVHREDHYVAAVQEAERRLRTAFGTTRRLTSLSSKFLRLRFGHPVIIYDRGARLALKTRDGDLASFASAWRARYQRDKAMIEAACRDLPATLPFALRSSDAGRGTHSHPATVVPRARAGQRALAGGRTSLSKQ